MAPCENVRKNKGMPKNSSRVISLNVFAAHSRTCEQSINRFTWLGVRRNTREDTMCIPDRGNGLVSPFPRMRLIFTSVLTGKAQTSVPGIHLAWSGMHFPLRFYPIFCFFAFIAPLSIRSFTYWRPRGPRDKQINTIWKTTKWKIAFPPSGARLAEQIIN